MLACYAPLAQARACKFIQVHPRLLLYAYYLKGKMSQVQVIKVVEVNRVLTWRFYFARILPVGFFMALTLHFGNIVYLYLTVSFIQMLKVARLIWSTRSPQLCAA